VFRQFPFRVWNSLVTPHFQNAKSLDHGNPMVLDQLRDAIASCLLTARGAPPLRGGQVMVVTGSQQGVWRQAFFPVVLPISKASK
jgi:DNA-binding transcriptional MocR family regulator